MFSSRPELNTTERSGSQQKAGTFFDASRSRERSLAVKPLLARTGRIPDRLRTIAGAIDFILLNLVTEDSFGGIQKLRGAFAVSPRRFQRILNDVTFVGGDCRFQ